MDIKTKSYISAGLMAALFCAALCFIPGSSFKTFVLKDIQVKKEALVFEPGKGVRKMPSVEIRRSNCLLDEKGSMVIDTAEGGYFFGVFPAPGNDATTLYINCYSLDGAALRLVVADPEKSELRTVSRRGLLPNQMFNISGFTDPDRPFMLGVISDTKEGSIVVERFQVIQVPVEYALPNLSGLTVCLIFAVMLFLTAAEIFKHAAAGWAAGAAVCIVFFAGDVFNIGVLESAYLWFCALVVLLAYRRYGAGISGVKIGEWLLPVLSIGMIMRWKAMFSTIGQPLIGDAQNYYGILKTFSWGAPYDTGIREPLYIWVQSLFSFFLGPNEFQFRITTIILSLAVIILVYFLALEFSGGSRPVALIASFLTAVNDYSVFSSHLGERTELFILLMLVFCLIIFKFKKAGWSSEICIGVAGGLASLTFLFCGIGAALLYCARWFMYRVKLKFALGAIAALFIIVGPHFVYEHKTNGDMFYALNKSVNYFRNTEVLGESSPEGRGGTWLKYLVEEMGVFHFIKRTTSGYLNLFFNPTNKFNKIFMGFHYTQVYSYFLFPFFIAGIVMELAGKRFRVFAMMLAFINFSLYSISDYYDPRLLFFISPFFAYFLGVGMVGAVCFSLNSYGKITNINGS